MPRCNAAPFPLSHISHPDFRWVGGRQWFTPPIISCNHKINYSAYDTIDIFIIASDFYLSKISINLILRIILDTIFFVKILSLRIFCIFFCFKIFYINIVGNSWIICMVWQYIWLLCFPCRGPHNDPINPTTATIYSLYRNSLFSYIFQ